MIYSLQTIPLISLVLESAVAFIFFPGDLRFLDTDRPLIVVVVVFFHVTKLKCCMLRNDFVKLQLSGNAKSRFISTVNK